MADIDSKAFSFLAVHCSPNHNVFHNCKAIDVNVDIRTLGGAEKPIFVIMITSIADEDDASKSKLTAKV